ncbi:hypothetical protein ACFJIW_16260 [Tahibacter sp. UC22_41]|uniref:hypothetical protein n=1 Tax=Tahibacter sp. UC22_41 TaxID=3350178 RepID=UPI0036D9A820
MASDATVAVSFLSASAAPRPSVPRDWQLLTTQWAIRAQVALTAGGPVTFDGHFDSVLFGPAGTVPVTLQRIDGD